MSRPTVMLVAVDVDELAALLALAAEARNLRRKRDEHQRTHWTGPKGRLTLPLGAVGALCDLTDGLDAVQADLAKRSG